MIRIFITNMCNDDNKGDLSLLQNTIGLLRRHFQDAQIIVQNGDYSKKDIFRYQLHRYTQRLADHYHGSFFPRTYIGGNGQKSGPLFFLAVRVLTSVWIQLVNLLSIHLGPRLRFLVPSTHREAWCDLIACDLVIAKGGSYIYSYGGFKRLLFTYRMLYTLTLAAVLGKRIILLGHSIGPFRSRTLALLAGRLLLRTDKIMLREKLSYDYCLQELGLPRKKLEIIPDLAFAFGSLAETPTDGIVRKIAKNEDISGLSQQDFLVAMTARNWWFPGQPNPQGLFDRYLKVMIEVITELRRRYRAKVFFIPHCLEDIEFMGKLHFSLKDRTDVFLLRGDYSPEELREILQIFQFIIGTRIHSNILALTAGIPVIAIAYEIHKGFGILEMAGQRDFVFDISKLDSRDLLAAVATIIARQPELRASIRQRTSALREELDRKVLAYLATVISPNECPQTYRNMS